MNLSCVITEVSVLTSDESDESMKNRKLVRQAAFPNAIKINQLVRPP